MTAPAAAAGAPARATAPVLPGRAYPLGATVRDGGTNFAVAAGAADGMLLCLFDGDGAESQIPLVDYDAGVWHGFVPGVGAGQPTPSSTRCTSRASRCATRGSRPSSAAPTPGSGTRRPSAICATLA